MRSLRFRFYEAERLPYTMQEPDQDLLRIVRMLSRPFRILRRSRKKRGVEAETAMKAGTFRSIGWEKQV